MEFLQNADPFVKGLWYSMLPASLIFLIQTVMTFAGSDASDGLDADFDGDVLHTDGPFQLFSFRNLIHFLLGFGWTGLGFYELIHNRLVLIIVATSAGLALVGVFFVVSKGACERAKHPHARDKASFIPELQELMEATGRVEGVSGDRSTTLGDAYSFSFSEGHTPGLMLTRVEGGERPVTFLGDLVPGTPWVHLPITMGYDRFPELLIEEKERVLARILAEDGLAFYTHDPKVVASRLTKGEKGKYMPLEPLARLAG